MCFSLLLIPIWNYTANTTFQFPSGHTVQWCHLDCVNRRCDVGWRHNYFLIMCPLGNDILIFTVAHHPCMNIVFVLNSGQFSTNAQWTPGHCSAVTARYRMCMSCYINLVITGYAYISLGDSSTIVYFFMVVFQLQQLYYQRRSLFWMILIDRWLCSSNVL